MKNCIITESGRECTTPECEGIKPYSEFAKQKDGKNGHTSRCKVCLQTAQNARRSKSNIKFEVSIDKRGLDFNMATRFIKYGLLA